MRSDVAKDKKKNPKKGKIMSGGDGLSGVHHQERRKSIIDRSQRLSSCDVVWPPGDMRGEMEGPNPPKWTSPFSLSNHNFPLFLFYFYVLFFFYPGFYPFSLKTRH